MSKKEILIAVVDGQGGGIGRQYIESLTSILPAKEPIIIRALGTNATATASMLKAGATDGATGENAIIANVKKADIIIGVVSIVIADSILGELSPKMAQAIGQSEAARILIPFDKCNTQIALLSNGSMQQFIDKTVELTIKKIKEIKGK